MRSGFRVVVLGIKGLQFRGLRLRVYGLRIQSCSCGDDTCMIQARVARFRD